MKLNKIHELIENELDENFDADFEGKVKEIEEILEALDPANRDEISQKMTSVRAKLVFLRGLLEDTIEAIEETYQ